MHTQSFQGPCRLRLKLWETRQSQNAGVTLDKPGYLQIISHLAGSSAQSDRCMNRDTPRDAGARRGPRPSSPPERVGAWKVTGKAQATVLPE